MAEYPNEDNECYFSLINRLCSFWQSKKGLGARYDYLSGMDFSIRTDYEYNINVCKSEILLKVFNWLHR